MKGLGIEITIGAPAAVRRLEQERDGLRVQLADAQDRLAFLTAEAQRVRTRAEKAEQDCAAWKWEALGSGGLLAPSATATRGPDPEIPLTALRRERDEALALVQKLRDFADDEQKRATFFQVEESKALDRVLKAEKERDEALAGVAKLAQAARAFVACFDWHAGQIFLARTGTESEAVEALHALRYALPAPPLAPLGTAPGGYEAESADEDATEPTPEEMPRAPTASDVRRMFAAMDEGASSREKPDA